MSTLALIDAPSSVRDHILDQMIDDAAPVLLRWVLGFDACLLEFRRAEGICECGEERP